eukprot:g14286.t1
MRSSLGSEDGACPGLIERYNIEANSWFGCAAASLANKIYVLGGFSFGGYLNLGGHQLRATFCSVLHQSAPRRPKAIQYNTRLT